MVENAHSNQKLTIFLCGAARYYESATKFADKEESA
jgi:hypothetical protein